MSTAASRRKVLLWGVVLVVIAAIVVAAFALLPDVRPKGGRADDDSSGTTDGTLPGAPGLRTTGYGRVQALGTVRYVDLEGGFWAIVDEREGSNTDSPKVVAVILNAEDVDIPEKVGQFVAVNGTLSEGASIRMAGPEIIAEEVFRPH